MRANQDTLLIHYDHLIVAVHKLIGVDVTNVRSEIEAEIVSKNFQDLTLSLQFRPVEHLAKDDPNVELGCLLARYGDRLEQLLISGCLALMYCCSIRIDLRALAIWPGITSI